MAEGELFPAIEPYRHAFLPVSARHTLYYEEVGNPRGVPVVFLHGGPGGWFLPDDRRFFDPAHYRVVLFEQRGCGRSTPHAELAENTTSDLVADIERLREALGIARWIVFGGSWGSTLGLAYAVTHPERVLGLVLRGVSLCRPHEFAWFYEAGGASHLFPDAWEGYVEPIPPAERGSLLRAYHRRLTGGDREEQLRCAFAWSKWEATTYYLVPNQRNIEFFGNPDRAIALARIECHYFANGAFLATDNFLLENAGKLRGIPGVIVHGRYDVVCPVSNAWDLHRAWPEAALTIVPDAGHAPMQEGTRRRLIEATEEFKRLRP
jgi:proline iminopeptidase